MKKKREEKNREYTKKTNTSAPAVELVVVADARAIRARKARVLNCMVARCV